MQTTATRTAGSHTDLLTGILNVQVRNEDKITEQDRQYCQLQQDQLYRTLDRIDRWYDIFKEEAERYREIKSFKYEENLSCFSFTGFSARNGMLPKQAMAKNAANNFALIPIGRSDSL